MPTSVDLIHLLQPLSGVRPDISRTGIPDAAAYYSENIARLAGKVVLRPGLIKLSDSLTGVVTSIMSFISEVFEKTTIVQTTRKIYRYDYNTNQFIDISGTVTLGGSSQFLSQMRVFFRNDASAVISVNGVDTPKVWQPSVGGAIRDVAGNPPVAHAVAVLANRVIMAHDGKLISVSAFNDFDAGWPSTQIVNLADTPGAIVSIVERSSLMAYIFKEDAMYEMQATGGKYPFRFEMRAAGIVGPASSQAIVTLPSGQFLYLGWDGNVYSFDGVNVQLASTAAQAVLARTADVKHIYTSFGYFDNKLQAAVFFFPDMRWEWPSMAIALTYPDMAVFPFRFNFPITAAAIVPLITPLTWEQIVAIWGPDRTWEAMVDEDEVPVFGSDGKLYSFNGLNDDGTPIDMRIESKAVPNDGSWHTLHTTEHMFSGTLINPQVEIVGSEIGEDESLLDASQLFNAQLWRYESQHRVTARTFAFNLTAQLNSQIEYKGSMLSLARAWRR